MLKHITVVPLAAESLGVRSMCTYVETPDVKILLDAGVSLCPKRFALSPHPKEFRAIDEARKRIAQAAEKSEIVTISHYHNNHHTPSFEDWLSNWTERTETAKQIYQSKIVLAKNGREQINYSQRERAWLFEKTGGKYASKIEAADGKTFTFNHTAIRFSTPVPHGPENTYLGWVIMAMVEFEEERFLFAADVQGPMSNRTFDLIMEERPQLIMIGGPPLYLSNLKVDNAQTETALTNLAKVVEIVPHVILDHHLLRDEAWREKSSNIFYSAYKSDHMVQTAAEFLDKKNAFLEASRKQLFADDPPLKEYEKWMKLGEDAKKHTKPPI